MYGRRLTSAGGMAILKPYDWRPVSILSFNLFKYNDLGVSEFMNQESER